MKSRWSTIALAAAIVFGGSVLADPTWPSIIDEMEDLMFLTTGYRNRGFAQGVTPCSAPPAGTVGRTASAEFIRTAFHDAIAGNVYFGTGGLDASIMFELSYSENIGAGFLSTLQYLSNFYNRKASASDLIALGLYAATRSCGGPIIPIRIGRKDATVASGSGLTPVPESAAGTFANQFARLGMDYTQMIALVACGHTVGGVHSANFPNIVAPNPDGSDNYQMMDSTTKFDNRIAVEWAKGNTTDPLAVGLAVQNKRASDAVVFSYDKNVTVKTLTDPATFNAMCASTFQQMIEVVPTGVVLTDPMSPYEIKPSNIQLTLLPGGTSMTFSGEIRVRTTIRSQAQIASVELQYFDRNGGSACGNCIIMTSPVGNAAGFDETFTFYSFTASVDSNTSISAFNIRVNLVSGTSQMYNNNGASYPIQDSIMFQNPQSCVGTTSDTNGNKNMTIVAAVRDTLSAASLVLSLETARPVAFPALSSVVVAMTKVGSFGPYNLWSASYPIPSGQSARTYFDVVSGAFADSFKSSGTISGTCNALAGGRSNGIFTSLTSTTSTASLVASISSSLATNQVTPTSNIVSTTTTTSLSIPTPTTTTLIPSATPTTSSSGTITTNTGTTTSSTTSSPSALVLFLSTSSSLSTSTLSLASSSVAATSYTSTTTSSVSYTSITAILSTATSGSLTTAPIITTTRSFVSTTVSVSSNINPLSATTTLSTTMASSPPGTPSSLSTTVAMASAATPIYTGWAQLGCYTDSVSSRSLPNSLTGQIDGQTSNMTIGNCMLAARQAGFVLAGLEYSGECWAGNAIVNEGSLASDQTTCNMACLGNPTQNCGGSNRLNVFSYTAPAATKTTTTSSGATTSAAAGPSGFVPLGCYADNVNGRVLPVSLPVMGGFTNMTNGACQAACFSSGFLFAGTEFSQECWCGTAIINGGAPASDGDTGCSYACRGNSAEICGGSNRLTVFQYTAITVSSTTATVGSPTFNMPLKSATAATTATNAPIGATSTSNPGSPWKPLGCYTDSVNNRVLVNGITVTGGASNMTNANCMAAGEAAGWRICGTEYSGECWCGSSIVNGGSLASDPTTCNMACNGDHTDVCGGSSRLSVFTFKDPASATPTGSESSVPLPSGWNYMSCYTDAVNARTLPYILTVPGGAANMTNYNCVMTAQALGWTWAGTEYSGECWGGLSISNTGGPASDGEALCDMNCRGNSTEICGGPSRLTMYHLGST